MGRFNKERGMGMSVEESANPGKATKALHFLRSRIWGKLTLVILLWVGFSAFTGDNPYSKSSLYFLDISTKEAIFQAKRRNKPVFVFAYATYCNTSQRMMNTVFKDKEFKKFISQGFICVKRNTESWNNNMELTNWGMHNVPGYIFLNKKGKIVKKEVGYKTKAEFLQLLQEVLEATKETPGKDAQDKDLIKQDEPQQTEPAATPAQAPPADEKSVLTVEEEDN